MVYSDGRVVILTLLIKCSSNISAEVETNSLFVEVTLQKTYNQNYGNKLHLDYSAFEDAVEKAVSAYNIQTNLIFTSSDKSFSTDNSNTRSFQLRHDKVLL